MCMSKYGSLIISVLALGIIIFIFFSLNGKQAIAPGQKDVTSTGTDSYTNEVQVNSNKETATDTLQVEDITVGTGKEVQSGDTIKIHYTGTLLDGTKFDSSYDRGEPFETQIGVGQVIKGWDEGVVGMKVGGKRKLVIPPDLAYGDQQVSIIPPNSTLVFEVELVGIQ